MGAVVESEELWILKWEEECVHSRRKWHRNFSQHPLFHSLEESKSKTEERQQHSSDEGNARTGKTTENVTPNLLPNFVQRLDAKNSTPAGFGRLQIWVWTMNTVSQQLPTKEMGEHSSQEHNRIHSFYNECLTKSNVHEKNIPRQNNKI